MTDLRAMTIEELRAALKAARSDVLAARRAHRPIATKEALARLDDLNAETIRRMTKRPAAGG